MYRNAPNQIMSEKKSRALLRCQSDNRRSAVDRHHLDNLQRLQLKNKQRRVPPLTHTPSIPVPENVSTLVKLTSEAAR